MNAPHNVSAPSTQPVVEAKDLKRVYEIRRGFMRAPDHLQAVGGVSFRSMPARHWPWWVNRAAASPRWRAWSR